MLRIATLASVVVLALAGINSGVLDAGLAVTPWPMFGGDVRHTGNSASIGPGTPTERWSFSTGNIVIASPAIGADGTLYLGSYDGKLYAINSDGSSKWTKNTVWWIRVTPAIGTDGTVYFGNWNNTFYAVDPSDGSTKWTFPIDGSVIFLKA